MGVRLETEHVYEFIVQGRTDGQASVNVLHYRTEEALIAPPVDADIDSLLSHLIGAWQSAVVDHVGATYAVTQYLLYEYTHSDVGGIEADEQSHEVVGNQLAVAGGPEDIGSLTGEMLPAYAAVGYRKVTAVRSRNYRGSMRISDIPEAMTQLNALTPTGQSTYAAVNLAPLLRPLIGPTNNYPVELCIFSKRLVRKNPFTDVLRQYSERVVAWILNPLITSQVSRKRKFSLGA